MNPMGVRTHCHFEYGTDANYGRKTTSRYAGFQITPRTAFATLECLYKQRVQAEAAENSISSASTQCSGHFRVRGSRQS